MKLKKSDIWKDFDQLDYVCITTNSIVKRNGDLVMGAGNAKQAVAHNNKLPQSFGQQIRAKGAEGKFYGLLLAEEKYIAFQTKLHYKDNSPLDVVQRSVDVLERLSNKYPNKQFGLPFPAINNGKRTVEEILPMLQKLPDNVTVYHLTNINLI